MGKNKGKAAKGKKANVFKVAGARSLKAKAKAKPVTNQLKKMKNISKSIDDQLEVVKKDLLIKREVKVKEKTATVIVKPPVSEKEKQETLQKMSDMQF